MACPSFLRRKLTYGIGNKILAPSGGVVYPPSVIQYYYELNNGVNSYIALPEITMTNGSYITIDFIGQSDLLQYQAMMGSLTHGFPEITAGSGLIAMYGGTSGTLDGEAIVNSVTEFPTDGGTHSIVVNIGSTTQVVDTIGAKASGAANFFSGVIYGVSFHQGSGGLTIGEQSYDNLNYSIIFNDIGGTIVRETVNGDAALSGTLINAQNESYIEV